MSPKAMDFPLICIVYIVFGILFCIPPFPHPHSPPEMLEVNLNCFGSITVLNHPENYGFDTNIGIIKIVFTRSIPKDGIEFFPHSVCSQILSHASIFQVWLKSHQAFQSYAGTCMQINI